MSRCVAAGLAAVRACSMRWFITTNPISPKRIKNATKRAKSAMASERAKPKMAYPKSCFESDGLRDTE